MESLNLTTVPLVATNRVGHSLPIKTEPVASSYAELLSQLSKGAANQNIQKNPPPDVALESQGPATPVLVEDFSVTPGHGAFRVFTCSQCGQTFKTRNSLYRHLHTIHTNPKSFVCKVCGKRFNQKANLQTHMYTHTGEKPYACHQCDYRTAYSCDLRKHEAKHDRARFVCEVCGMPFISHGNYRRHIENTHAQTPLQSYRPGATRSESGNSSAADPSGSSDDIHLPPTDTPVESDPPSVSTSQNGKGSTPEVFNKNSSEKADAEIIPNPLKRPYAFRDRSKTRITHADLDIDWSEWEDYFLILPHSPRKSKTSKDARESASTSQGESKTQNDKSSNAPQNKGKTNAEELPSNKSGTEGGLGNERTTTAGRYSCNLCPQLFQTRKSLYRHIQFLHNKPKSYECTICGKRFNQKGNLQVHMYSHTGEKPLQCAHCEYRTAYGSDLKKHEEKHVKAKYSCPFCNMPFLKTGNLKWHIESLHPEQNATVISQQDVDASGTAMEQAERGSGANVTLRSLPTLKKHFACTKCTYTTAYKHDLNKHEKKHANARLHCEDCNRPFVFQGNLDQHIRACHPEKVQSPEESPTDSDEDKAADKIYECKQCTFETAYKSQLNKHMRKHSELSYHCSLCNMPYTLKGNLERHLRTHGAVTESPDSPLHKCDTCTFKTQHKTELERHRKKHETANFHCSKCNMPYTLKGNLERHMKIHEENPPEENQDALSTEHAHASAQGKSFMKPCSVPLHSHQCHMCAYQTIYKGDLNKHVAKHTNCNYSCNDCNMPFVLKGNLDRHMRSNHDANEDVSCELDNSDKQKQQEENPVKDMATAGDVDETCQPTCKPAASGEDKQDGDKPTEPDEVKTITKEAIDNSKTQPTKGSPPFASSFQEFRENPYACALCWYRTGEVSKLVLHVGEHLMKNEEKVLAETTGPAEQETGSHQRNGSLSEDEKKERIEKAE